MQNTDKDSYTKLFNIIQRLRSEDGCPWDKEQTPYSMRHDILEECYESIDAITQDDSNHAKEELGDLFFVLLLTSYMYQQNGSFSVDQMLEEVSEKLIRRHPHVFKDSEGACEVKDEADTTQKILDQWDRIKDNVEGRKKDSILDGIPEEYPPLLKAYKMTAKATKIGFEWNNINGAVDKVNEEWTEVLQALEDVQNENAPKTQQTKNKLHLEEEIGDVLFALANFSRYCGIDPTIAMDKANRKFYNRFTYVEKKVNKAGTKDLDKLTEYWKEAKKLGL